MPKRATEKVKKLRAAYARGEFNNSLQEDVQTELDPKNEKSKSHKIIVQQVQDEYDPAWRFMRPKIQEGLIRLKLYNNQRRDKDRVGDPMLFTITQTLLAALWDDKLLVEFEGREEGDQDQADNLNGTAEYDHDEMGKAQHDYEWIFDTLAFCRGLSYFNTFDRATKTPIPIVWDPLTFIRDPYATSVNGNRLREGQMRYGYREVTLTREQMEATGDYFNLDLLGKTGSENNIQGLSFEMRQARSQAQGTENLQITKSASRTGSHAWTVLQGFSVIDGEKYWVEVANERTLLIRMKPIVDAQGKPSDLWPLIDRPCFPIAHDWDGVSVWDLIEDKQRYRATLLNLLGDSARASVYPMYLFNENKIKKSIDKSFGFNKWIGVDGDINAAAAPLQKSQPNAEAQNIMNLLDVAAQKALATPDLQQGVQSTEKRTATELDLISSKVDTRYSLTAKLFGLSEKRFWGRWYELYDENFEPGIDKKVIRLTGTFGPVWRDITRDKIIMGNPLGPDIKIESRVLSEAKKQRQFQQATNFSPLVLQDPEADKTYYKRKMARLIYPKDEVERIFPLTIDERVAKDENEKLSKDEIVQVKVEDNHVVHLRMHVAAKDTAAKVKHVMAHEKALMIKRQNPDLFPQMPEDIAQNPDMKTQQGGMPVSKAPEGVSTPL